MAGEAVISSLTAHALLQIVLWGSDGPALSGPIGMYGSHTPVDSVLAEDGVIEWDFRKRHEEKPS